MNRFDAFSHAERVFLMEAIQPEIEWLEQEELKGIEPVAYLKLAQEIRDELKSV